MKAALFALSLCCSGVYGAVIAEASADNGSVTVELHDQDGHCQDGAKLSMWIQPNGTLLGCWKLVGAVVYIAWSDADFTKAPIELFKPPTKRL